jgi:DNA-binding transcriptional LysR family regulator
VVKVTDAVMERALRRAVIRLIGSGHSVTIHLSRRLARHGTLPQLTAFETIVRLGSYTRAADSLAMAQPTISGHMRKLTEAVGQPLLVIEGRRVRPTAAGQALLQATREIFAALERADRAISTPPSRPGHDAPARQGGMAQSSSRSW